MKAIISVLGGDRPGIIAEISVSDSAIRGNRYGSFETFLRQAHGASCVCSARYCRGEQPAARRKTVEK